MGRQVLPKPAVSGTVKGVQHISQVMSIGSSTSTDVSITAVSDVNKAYIIHNGDTGSSFGAEGSDVRDRSSVGDTTLSVQLTGTTTVNVAAVDFDRPDYFTRRSSTFVGSVVEVT